VNLEMYERVASRLPAFRWLMMHVSSGGRVGAVITCTCSNVSNCFLNILISAKKCWIQLSQ